jgi:hypothetical protein
MTIQVACKDPLPKTGRVRDAARGQRAQASTASRKKVQVGKAGVDSTSCGRPSSLIAPIAGAVVDPPTDRS